MCQLPPHHQGSAHHRTASPGPLTYSFSTLLCSQHKRMTQKATRAQSPHGGAGDGHGHHQHLSLTVPRGVYEHSRQSAQEAPWDGQSPPCLSALFPGLGAHTVLCARTLLVPPVRLTAHLLPPSPARCPSAADPVPCSAHQSLL